MEERTQKRNATGQGRHLHHDRIDRSKPLAKSESAPIAGTLHLLPVKRLNCLQEVVASFSENCRIKRLGAQKLLTWYVF